MQLYPAIDLRDGRVVRLKEGDPNRQTVFSDQPLAVAQRWRDDGATWLHVVNLDGALGETSPNLDVLRELTKLRVPVQFGGGLRSLEDVHIAFEAGVARVVLGTLAIQQPQIVGEVVTRYGADAVCVGLDAKHGKITTHGWQTTSEVTPVELGQRMAGLGAKHALYTDVTRDGLLGGVNVVDTVLLAEQTGLQVIASGGVKSLDDLRALKASGKVAGAIIGMALYVGQFTLPEALSAVL
jgi:phosphoribosylformimino-5-aminoimidazole carboxamide ribotide isomerase